MLLLDKFREMTKDLPGDTEIAWGPIDDITEIDDLTILNARVKLDGEGNVIEYCKLKPIILMFG